MPKTEIDYSSTIIYKITCKDENIKDVYVGHTTNFVQRKHGHKQGCTNEKSTNYNCKVYKTIRENGGWNNWSMEIINFFNCADHYEARKKEQEYFVLLNATLNSIEPMPKPKAKEIVEKTETKEKQTYYCKKCNIFCINEKKFAHHNGTKKHKKYDAMDDDKNQNLINPTIIYCDKCDFKCSKPTSYKTHILTAHRCGDDVTGKNPEKLVPFKIDNNYDFNSSKNADYKNTFITTNYKLNNVLEQDNSHFFCNGCNFKTKNKKDYGKHLLTLKHKTIIAIEESKTKIVSCNICNKEYKSRNGLWYHKKKCEKTQKMQEKCQPSEDAEIFSHMSDKEIIMQLLKQNNDLTQKMIEIASTPSTNNSHNNSHNKQFNMNFFLNDTCKNAMNIDDFIDSLQIETEELENVGKLGYVEGISNIFIRGLKDLDETKRPMHCLDKKRETLYIKNGDAWNKDEKREKVKEVIGKLGHKNFMKLMEWKMENPQHENSETKKHAQYTEIVKQVFTCITPDDDNGINKIIRKVANEVCVDKAATVATVL
jgi:hypothetical protein